MGTGIWAWSCALSGQRKGAADKRGTKVTFLPDTEIFQQTIEFSYDVLANRMRELAFLNKGIRITLTDLRNKNEKGEPISQVFYSEKGLEEFIQYLDGNRTPIIKKIIAMEGEKNGYSCGSSYDL